jgi:selenocysteine lyase/cysteine desulfurase
MKLDLDFVRGQFPAFSEPSLRDQVFFENAGGSFACQPVIDRLNRFYRQRKVQPYAPYEAAQLGGAEMDEARARLAAMLGVLPDEVNFGPSTSANTYVLAQAFKAMLKPGDAIIVTNQDHEANSGVWRRLVDAEIEIREWKIDTATGHLPLERLADLLDEGVKLVCFPHVSNIVGEINPVAEICAMVHAVGAVACVDGVSFVPHGFPNVGELGADVYLFSAYKTYGPHQGIMVLRSALNVRLPNQGHYFNRDLAVKRFTPAGPDHAQIAACAGMADYVDAMHARHFGDEVSAAKRAAAVLGLQAGAEERVLEPLLDYLRGRNDLRLIGPSVAAGRVPTVAVRLERPGEDVAVELGRLGLNCWGGDFYAVRLLEALGIEPSHGVLRMSFVHYTSEADVARLVAGLERVL